MRESKRSEEKKNRDFEAGGRGCRLVDGGVVREGERVRKREKEVKEREIGHRKR